MEKWSCQSSGMIVCSLHTDTLSRFCINMHIEDDLHVSLDASVMRKVGGGPTKIVPLITPWHVPRRLFRCRIVSYKVALFRWISSQSSFSYRSFSHIVLDLSSDIHSFKQVDFAIHSFLSSHLNYEVFSLCRRHWGAHF
jgi:hypothetical protein